MTSVKHYQMLSYPELIILHVLSVPTILIEVGNSGTNVSELYIFNYIIQLTMIE